MPVLPTSRNFRNDLWQLLFKTENDWGQENNHVRNHGNLLGIVEQFDYPDTEYEYYTHRHVRPTTFMPPRPTAAVDGSGKPPGVSLGGTLFQNSPGTPSVRNWVAIYNGRRRNVGSISDIKMLSGHVLPFIFGAASNETAEVVGTGAYQTNYHKHYVTETSELPSFTLEAINFNTDGTNNLVRRARGCKINRATISASEGEEVRIAIEEFIAKGIRHNLPIGATAETAGDLQEYLGYHANLNLAPGYQPLDLLMGTARNSLTDMDTYKFSEGHVEIYRPDGNGTIGGTNQPDIPNGEDDESNPKAKKLTVLARIRSFRLTVNNNLTANYWINDLNRKALPDTTGQKNELVDWDSSQKLLGQTQPTGITEGHREYEFELVLAVTDPYIYELLNQEGRFGPEKRGFGIKIKFSRQLLGNAQTAFGSNDYMEMRMPSDTSGITGRNWEIGYGSFNYNPNAAGVTPVAGTSVPSPVMGCFFSEAPHAVDAATSEPLLYVTCRLLVPSCSILIRDRFNDYLHPGPYPIPA